MQNLVSGWQEEIEKQLPLRQHGASPSISLSTYLGRFQSYLKSTTAECVVSPANSFGLMDGGLDLALSKYYGGVANLVPIVRRALVDEWCGEQNVGTCLIVDVHELVERAKQGGQVVNVPRYTELAIFLVVKLFSLGEFSSISVYVRVRLGWVLPDNYFLEPG